MPSNRHGQDRGAETLHKLRGIATTLCCILCVLGLASSVVHLYSSRTLFNASRFSDRIAASLEQPAVAQVVAEQLADQILTLHRDLTAYRPLLLSSLQYVVSSSPFRAAVRRAARSAHATLLSSSGEHLALNVNDFGVLARTAFSEHPEIATRVPASARFAIDFTQGLPLEQHLASILRIGHRMRARALYSFLLALFAGFVGLLLTRRRDHYLLTLGLGLVTLSFLVAGVAHFGDMALARFTRTSTGAELLHGLWPVFVGPLAIRMLILGGLGLVLVAAVTSLLEKVSLQALATRVAGWISIRHGRVRWALLRGAVLTTAGLVVLFHPSESLVVFAVLGGAVFLFAGVQEIFSTVAGMSQRFAPVPVDTQPNARTWPILVSIAVLVAGLSAAGAFWLDRVDRGAAIADTPSGACNGDFALCGRRLDQVAFPATHNSMSAADEPDWMFPNQERGIPTQLTDGVRGFLIDVHYGVPVGDRVKTLLDDEPAARAQYEAVIGKEGVDAAMRIRDRLVGQAEGERDVYTCHGFCELGDLQFTQVLRDMRTFLVANPGEVLILILQDEGVTPEDVAACFARSALLDFVYRGPVTPPWPTLGEMVRRDERVVVFAEHDAAGVVWYHQAFDVFQETPYRFTDPSEFSNAVGRGGTRGSLLLLNHWIETAPAPLPSNAEIVNAYDVLYPRAVACREERGMIPNLVAVDFYRTGDLFRVVRTLNGLSTTTP